MKDVQMKKDHVWHAMKKHDPKQRTMIAEKAEGVWVETIEGERFLDAMSGLWCVNVGYGREELAEAAAAQMKKMAFYPLAHSHFPAMELADKLNEWLGGDYMFFFSNSGSEANETAFKIARQYHSQAGSPHRYKIVSRYRAYHGNTMGALAATGQSQRKVKYEPLATGFLHTIPPDCYHCPLQKEPSSCGLACADLLDQTIDWELSETVAAVIMEPIITGGGLITPPDGYLQKVEAICKKHGALLIIDEVICGFGRTGKPFGFMHEGITPDMITMAKGLTSAYMPLSVTAVRKEIFEAFQNSEEYSHFRHINTFGGHPAACEVAKANLRIIEEENLCERAEKMGELLYQSVKSILAHPNVGDIRHKGLLLGIELVHDKVARTPISGDIINKVIGLCKQQGVLIGRNGDTVAGYTNVLTIAPPLIVDEEELALISKAVRQAIETSCGTVKA